MAISKWNRVVMQTVIDHGPVTPEDLRERMIANGTQVSIKWAEKYLDALGIKGYIKGSMLQGFEAAKIPHEMRVVRTFKAAHEIDPEELWWGYSIDHTDEQATARFEETFGYTPARLLRTGGGILVGPITKDERASAS